MSKRETCQPPIWSSCQLLSSQNKQFKRWGYISNYILWFDSFEPSIIFMGEKHVQLIVLREISLKIKIYIQLIEIKDIKTKKYELCPKTNLYLKKVTFS